MRVLVTGGAGYIGSHIVEELIAKGHSVVIFDSMRRGNEKAIHPEATFIQCDLKDNLWLSSAMRDEHRVGIDAVIHAAALAYVDESTKHPLMYYHNNVTGTLNLLMALVDYGINNLVFCSSCTAGHATNPYGQSKAMVERMITDTVKQTGLKAAILRYYNVAGASENGTIGECHDPETHLIPLCIRAAMAGGTFIVDGNDYDTRDGTCVRDYVHVHDVARVTVEAISHVSEKCEITHVGTGVGSTVQEVIAACEVVVGKKVERSDGPRRNGNDHAIVAPHNICCGISQSSFRPLSDIVESAYGWEVSHPNGYSK
jgi:UDP-glucose 4-epimerase